MSSLRLKNRNTLIVMSVILAISLIAFQHELVGGLQLSLENSGDLYTEFEQPEQVGNTIDQESSPAPTKPSADFTGLLLRSTHANRHFDPSGSVQYEEIVVKYLFGQSSRTITIEISEDFRLVSDNSFAWSHSGVILAVVVRDLEERLSLLLVDTITQETRHIGLNRNIVDGDTINIENSDWSPNGNWLHIRHEDFYQFVREYIVNVVSEDTIELNYRLQEEFLGWDPSSAQSFFYLASPYYPEYGGESIIKADPDTLTDLAIFTDFDGITPSGNDYFAISQNGNYILVRAASIQGSYPTYLLIDISNGDSTAKLVRAKSVITNNWSPDGKWMVFHYFDQPLYIMEIGEKIDVSMDVGIEVPPPATPIGWLEGETVFLYRIDSAIFAVNIAQGGVAFPIEGISLAEVPVFAQIDPIPIGAYERLFP